LQLTLRLPALFPGLETYDLFAFDFFLFISYQKQQFYQKNKINILFITLKMSIFNKYLKTKAA